MLKSHSADSPPKNNDSSIQNNGAKIQNNVGQNNGAKIQNNVGNGNGIHHVCQQHNVKSPLLTSPTNEIEADKEIVVGPKLAGNGNYNDCKESADMWV